MRMLVVILLCITSVAILVALILPAAALTLGLGFAVPRWWRLGKFPLVYSHPSVSLLVGTLLLALVALGVWKLMRV
jgi:hypothetical protein